MKKFLRRRGQTVVEFALLLPIFALILFATIYVGFFVLDYVTLDAAATAAAREAALDKKTHTISSKTRKKIKDRKRFLNWYTMVDDSPKITTSDGYVTVMIQAKRTKSNKLLELILPEEAKAYTVSQTAKIP